MMVKYTKNTKINESALYLEVEKQLLEMILEQLSC